MKFVKKVSVSFFFLITVLFFVNIVGAEETVPQMNAPQDDAAVYEPFDDFSEHWEDWANQIHHQMGRRFYQFLHDMEDSDSFRKFNFSPDMDVVDDGEKYVVSFDLPGMDKEAIEIEVVEDVLTVRATRESKWESNEEGEDQYIYKSARKYGEIARSLRLPEEVNKDKIDANYENGVLEISLPYEKKALKEEVLKVEVK